MRQRREGYQASSAASAYVRHDGRLVRSRWPMSLIPSRVLLALAVASVLIVTNPANEVHRWPEKARGVWDGLVDKVRHRRLGGFGYDRDDRYYGKTAPGKSRSGGGKGGEYADSLWEAIDAVSYSIFGTDSSSFLGDVFGGGRGTAAAGARMGASTTNYVLYSLERDYAGVRVAGLSNRFDLCQFSGFDPEGGGDLCRWIDKLLCHGKAAFDPANRAFTAHRLLESAVLLSAVLSFCSRGQGCRPGASLRRLTTHPLDVVLSVFAEPSSWISDLFNLNMFVYPALESMERLLSKGDDPSTEAARFYFLSLLLAVGIGSVSNLAGSWASGGGREVGGLRGSAAAGLGYLMAVRPNRSVVSYWGMRMNPSEVLLAASAVGFISLAGGVDIGVWRWDAGSLMAWVCGGLMGNAFAKNLLKRYGLGWFSFY